MDINKTSLNLASRNRCFAVKSLILVAMLGVMPTSAYAFQDPPPSTERETEFLAVLRSDAADSEKALACKNLAIYGSSNSVPELSKLLPNQKLSSWARIALEAIPGSAADKALRDAAETLQGKLLIGMLNSIGFRRDANAVNLLTEKLQDPQADVAAAAAVALGKIGNAPATQALRTALPTSSAVVRSAVAEGCVLCAEQLHNAGDLAAAIEIYDEVRAAEVPMQRIVEATRGAILARDQAGIPLLLETVRSPNTKLFQLALGTIREFPGNQIDKELAVEWEKATAIRAALLIQAMADRPQTVLLDSVLKAAKQGDDGVRLSAIVALRRIGDDTCLASLMKIAAEDDKDLADAAIATLADLPGENVDEEIARLLPNSAGDKYRLLLQLVGQRRINLVELVEKALDHPDDSVRNAAFVALGETVSLDDLSVLVSQVINPVHPQDVDVAQRSLKTACVRMPDREACAVRLKSALEEAPAGTKSFMLEILSEVGGVIALQTLAQAAKSDDGELQDTSSRLLGKWNNVDAAPVLLDLAKSAPVEKYRVRAVRGYIGIARKFAMPNKTRADMCRNALNATNRQTEHKLVLDVLRLHPSAATMKLAIEAIDLPGMKSDATETALVVGHKLAGKGVDVKKLLSGIAFDKVKLEIISAQYGAGTNQKEVTSELRKLAGDIPLITMGTASYNASFGGDPAPGEKKKLSVRYRIDGKSGEASFDENALIVLPTPK